MKLTTYELVLCAFCAAVTCILAPLSVPLAGEVPISLATFAVLLSGILLGGKLGALSQIVYVLLGSVGVPVFAGWTGGIGITLGVTGGYIIGYMEHEIEIDNDYGTLKVLDRNRKTVYQTSLQ